MNDSFWNQLRAGAQERFAGFGHLMPFRVQEILLVASMYDAFTLEEGLNCVSQAYGRAPRAPWRQRRPRKVFRDGVLTTLCRDANDAGGCNQ